MKQDIIDWFDEFIHTAMPRRTFFSRLVVLAGGTAAATALLPLLQNSYASASLVDEADARLRTEFITYPGVAGDMRGYLAQPAEAITDLPVVIVIHENRGLNPYIQDVVRRIALEDYVALGPDFRSPLGGTPSDEDQARELISILDSEQTLANARATLARLQTYVAILLPLIGGAAGALNLCQAKSSSLVSGSAVGMLVAAALAPPAALIGMAVALGRWELVLNGAFLLLLHLLGIHVAATVVFRAYGLSTQGARYQRGKRWIFPVGLGISSVLILGLLTAQLSSLPYMQRASLAQRATAEISQVIDASDLADLAYADVRFTQIIQDQNTLLCLIQV